MPVGNISVNIGARSKRNLLVLGFCLFDVPYCSELRFVNE
jgi:hypothetical protein